MPEAPDALVDRLLADPPAINAMDFSDHPRLGVWAADRDCYVFLAEHAGPRAHTLETGSGLSTVLLAAVGARHVCVTPDAAEAERVLAYCKERGIDTSSLSFEIGCSDVVLPGLDGEQLLDLVFIDGNHGFPTPVIDWYYAGSRLRPGGFVVLDDVGLPAVAGLCAFVDHDPRWELHQRTEKWVAYRRVTAGGLRQDWYDQPFYQPTPQRGRSTLPGRVIRKLRAGWRRVSGTSAAP